MEVDDEALVGLTQMRYPVEDGNLSQASKQNRKRDLVEFLQVSQTVAMEIADLEFAHLMATSNTLVSKEDPGNSRFILGQYGCTDEEFISKSIQFFQNCDSALVQTIPMKTFQKFRYGSGVQLSLLKKNEKPDLKDYWTINTNRLTNIASQLNLKGCFSSDEEFMEQQKEKAMLKCAHEFGITANTQIETFDFIESAVRTARKWRARGGEQEEVQKADSEELVLGSDVASTTHGKTQKMKIKLR